MQSIFPSIYKIISGGQTGVDQAGLRVGKALGFKTGGYAPKGWLIRDEEGEDKPFPELADFGLIEATGAGYASRTRKNVQIADLTIAIAKTFKSPGEKLTFKTCVVCKKPILQVNIDDENGVKKIQRFLRTHRPRVVNIAGNGEFTAKGIGQEAEGMLMEALTNQKTETEKGDSDE